MEREKLTIHSERGFTLIELLTVVGIIGVVSALGVTSFYVYKADAAYAVVARLLQDSIQAVEGSLSIPDQTLPSVSGYSQSAAGAPTDPDVATILTGIVIPRKVKFEFSFDPSCADASCVLASVQANHCGGRDYPRWLRYGDGVDVRLEHIAGVGCP